MIVFGTGIINVEKFKNVKAINLHWGISPTYRGEGIVSALSRNDFDYLGVTVHKLSKKIDDGKIISQKVIIIDKYDNFYSIGLKMGIYGSDLILNIIKNKSKKIFVQKHDKSRLYDSKYFKNNYIDFYLAYKNLEKKKLSL